MDTAGCKAKQVEEQPMKLYRVICAAAGLLSPHKATQEEMEKGPESFVYGLDLGLSSEELRKGPELHWPPPISSQRS